MISNGSVNVSKGPWTSAIQAALLASLAIMFPWEYIMRAEQFTDYERYVEYFNSNPDFKFVSQGYVGIWSFISGEALWNVANIALADLTGDARIPLRIFSWVTFFLWAYTIVRRSSLSLAMLFLFNPIVIDVGMSGIRNGVAWSLFFFALYELRSLGRNLVFLTCIFIHTTTLFLVGLFIMYSWLGGRSRVQRVHFYFVGAAVGLLVTVGSSLVSSFLPDRRLIDYGRGGVSLLQPTYFLIALSLFLVSFRKRFIDVTQFFAINVITFFLALSITISWSYRVWGAAIPVIALLHAGSFGGYKNIVLWIWILYSSVWYIYWTKILEFW